ncbi:hypothetical protein [Photorhabdus sp. CRCIA-P01]|uniref:hypothetical protein n=1 Tax=Photorhabdus sp. CRCIA-P01 TaxID=2019570 RepID=UPI000E59FC1F|nr:hypothetical protein [Photorhabdus sp. CRCIA-P01]
MSQTSSSQAQTNFTSSSGQGLYVDPRTGWATANFLLASLPANNNLGPSVQLSISYSPFLSDNPYDVGIGCSLGLSSYNYDTKQLTLNTGEQYYLNDPATVSGSTQLEVNQKKLDNFVVYKEQAPGEGYQYRVVYKNGTVDILRYVSAVLYMPALTCTPVGHYVTYAWNVYGDSMRLINIVDESENILFQGDYSDTEATFHFWPNVVDEAYSITLIKGNEYLQQITNAAVDPVFTWTLTYSVVNGMSNELLTGILAPTGYTQSVQYESGAMNFPSQAGVKTALPAVTQSIQSPGAGQPDIVTNYNWSSNNYLGYGYPGMNNYQDYQDNCLQQLDDSFSYSSTAGVSSGTGDGAVAVSIQRTYNNYHLLIQKVVTQAGYAASTTIDITYYAENGLSLDQQPDQYQCLTSQTTTYSDGTNSRAEVTAFTFDEFGNMLTSQSPDGTTDNNGTLTTYTYYPGDQNTYAEDNITLLCPADPNGITRFVQSQTIVPAATTTSYDDVPTQRVEYRYSTIDCLAANGAPMAGKQAIIQVQEDHYSQLNGNDIHLLTKVTDYTTDSQSDWLGQITQITSTVFGLDDPNQTFISTATFNVSIQDGTTLYQDVTFTSPDNLSFTVNRSQSCYSGKVTSLTDRQGNVTTFDYDLLGRVTQKTLNAGDSTYQTTQTISYTLTPGRDDTKASTVRQDANGNQQVTTFDGMGRTLSTSVNGNAPGFLADILYVIGKQAYDAMGRVVLRQSFDYTNPNEPSEDTSPVPSSTRQQTISYDDWGRPATVMITDGTEDDSNAVTITSTYNPAVTSTVNNETVTTALLCATASGISTGYQQVDINPQKKPIRVTHLDHTQTPLGYVTRTYDGLGQLRQEEDEVGSITQWIYDAYGRVSQTTLPENSTVNKTYYAGSSKPLISSISITDGTSVGATPIVLGTQTFDGLHRLTAQTNCGRSMTYGYSDTPNYQGIQLSSPNIITDALGQVVNIDYILQLNEAVSGVTANNADCTPVIMQTVVYDPVTGLPVSTNETDSQSQTMSYTLQGNLSSEEISPLVPVGVPTRTASYVYTLMGRPQQYIDVTGAIQIVTYNSYGRLITLDDPAATVTIAYDALGRVLTRKTVSKETSYSLTLELNYDDMSREIQRDITDQNGVSQLSIATTYYTNSQVESRITTQGGTILRQEGYIYDSRHRLVEYTVSGSEPPADSYGMYLKDQMFTYDALGNITVCATTFWTDNTMTTSDTDTATFIHGNANDPTQLTEVRHSNTTYYPSSIFLSYDTNGRMTIDEAGRTLTYDPLGRLAGVSGNDIHGQPIAGGTYGYDATNTLIRQVVTDGDTHLLYYTQGGEQSVEVQVEAQTLQRQVKLGHTCLGISEEDVTTPS